MMRILDFLIGPKLTQEEAFQRMMSAAAAKGWEIDAIHPFERNMHLYSAISFIKGTAVAVLLMVDGKSCDVLQLERVDEIEDSENS